MRRENFFVCRENCDSRNAPFFGRENRKMSKIGRESRNILKFGRYSQNIPVVRPESRNINRVPRPGHSSRLIGTKKFIALPVLIVPIFEGSEEYICMW